MGAVVNTVRTIAENAPTIAAVAKKGYQLGSSAGSALTSAAKGVNNLFTSRRKNKANQGTLVASSANTQSQNRANAPTSLSIKFDGPEYRFSSCSFQGMPGLRMTCRFVYASIEQNTTTTLRGALRDLSLAGTAGDTSMLGSAFSPVAVYTTSTQKGRLGMTTTVLYNMAAVFRKYRVTGLSFKYESELPTTTAGGLALGFSADAAEVSAVNALTVAQYGCSLITSIWDDAILDCSQAINRELMNSIPYGASVTNLTANMYSPGTVFAAFDQANTANLVCGKLICECNIEMYSPAPVVASYAEALYRDAVKRERADKVYLEIAARAEAAQKAKDEASEREAVEYFEMKEPVASAPTPVRQGFVSISRL